MHRLLFLLTVYGAAENECLQLVGSSAELDFEPSTDFFPATALKEFTLEDASSLDTNLLQIHGHRVERAAVLEEIELFVAFTEEMFCDSRGLGASLGVELAEIGDGLLADFLPVAYRAHESPVGVGLAVTFERSSGAGTSLFTPTPVIIETTDAIKPGGWHYISIPANALSTTA